VLLWLPIVCCLEEAQLLDSASVVWGLDFVWLPIVPEYFVFAEVALLLVLLAVEHLQLFGKT
jgi:hypothetical protein